MHRLALCTPSRLHFGLLSWGDATPRRFGGVGLMVRDPGLEVVAEPAGSWGATGPSAARVLAAAGRAARLLEDAGVAAPPLRFEVRSAPPEHVGLGVGTQAGMAAARLVAEAAGRADLPAAELARLAGRGLRSGIGLHGFARGGLIVDGGRGPGDDAPAAPLLAHLDFPADWAVLIVIPPDSTGLHGGPEARAFGQLPPPPASTVDRLCRLVLLDLLPAVAEHDLPAFGAALAEIQVRVGQGFAPAQGGTFAGPARGGLVPFLRSLGLVGVGQSSWGPTLYGFAAADPDRETALVARVLDRTGWPAGSAFWTRASPTGARPEAARAANLPSPIGGKRVHPPDQDRAAPDPSATDG